MFTGIVQAIGTVTAIEPRGGDLRLRLDIRELASRIAAARLAVGESVAVSGVCLTVVQHEGDCFTADVSRETLDVTTLGALRAGDRVNLEAALRAGDPLGGHLMSGHVDGIAEVTGIEPDGRSLRVTMQTSAGLMRFIAPKGSLSLDGVSLTVNEVEDSHFGVNLIPHTMEVTTFDRLALGQRLNLEVDLLARYVQRALNR